LFAGYFLSMKIRFLASYRKASFSLLKRWLM